MGRGVGAGRIRRWHTEEENGTTDEAPMCYGISQSMTS